jgi:hypothetical protein
MPKLSTGWQHNYSTKTRQAGRVNEQYMYCLIPMLGMNEMSGWLENVDGLKWNLQSLIIFYWIGIVANSRNQIKLLRYY